MPFFDQQGNSIQSQQWLKTYEPYYFLGGPKLSRKIDGRNKTGRIDGRNQTSHFVENEVCALLSLATPMSQQDLTLVMAWKIGGIIDHAQSEASQRIVYRQSNWPTTLTAISRFGTLDFSRSIPELANRMNTISDQINQGNPRYLFDLAPRPKGFGHVYILTALFFASHGKYPIYDKYAHIAAQAINQDLPPWNVGHYKELQNWNDYEDYMGLLSTIKEAFQGQVENSSMFISRSQDRALWVYGHLSGSDEKSPNCTQ
jgi:hypothetical protein